MAKRAGELDGRTALITGAGSGIGREAALLMAAAGATVVVCDLDVDGGEETARQIESAGGRAAFVRADVAQAMDVERAIDARQALYEGRKVRRKDLLNAIRRLQSS